jgi:hypothetical protein
MSRTLPAVLAAAVLGLLALPAVAAAEPQRSIVVLGAGAGDPAVVAREHGRRFGADVGRVYHTALRGYAAAVPAERLTALRDDPRVAYVEPDGWPPPPRPCPGASTASTST